ncbi:MAG: histone deacetylase [Methanomicrobiales archaeon]|nr:histone deacetylase [Methanomicrobiales archaeon]
MHRCAAITGGLFTHHDIPSQVESNIRLENAQAGIPEGIPIIKPVKAEIRDLELVHSPGHIAWLREMSQGERFIDSSTYITRCSFEVALYAAGSAMRAAEMALEGISTFALVRPPGHHAERDRAMGYCLMNNVAIAAAAALKRVEKVAIVDWDLHHGNGTQQIFYESDRVLFCSVHQFNVFPFTGWVDEIGEGKGRGYNLNAPLEPNGDIGDYMAVFRDVFMPAIVRFDPDVIIISAGEDALEDDPHGQMALKPNDYQILTQMLLEACDQPIALVLEGGYGPSIGEAVTCIFNAMKGERVKAPECRARKRTARVISTLRKIWFV